jgi:GR25 family glycosyltransferase involved in LPS biosynthesis
MTSHSVNNCLIINLDTRSDLWEKLKLFRENWEKHKKIVERISGVSYKNQTNVLIQFIKNNRINLNGLVFRNNKDSFLGELGCFMGHYNCWKYIVDNKLNNCLILEDGIEVLREDFENLKIINTLDILFVNEEMKLGTNNKTLFGYGLQGYILTKTGAEKLLKKCYTLILPIDLQIRQLCNKSELNYSVIQKPYFKRDHNRVSSIEDTIMNDESNLNTKQNPNTIIQRILTNLLIKNINLDDYL